MQIASKSLAFRVSGASLKARLIFSDLVRASRPMMRLSPQSDFTRSKRRIALHAGQVLAGLAIWFRANLRLLHISVPILILALLTLGRCISSQRRAEKSNSEYRVSILAYNVENLFDTEHDSGREDFTFLPLALKSDPAIRNGCLENPSKYRRKECLDTDWNEAVLKEKMKRIGDVLETVNNGRGADIVILSEVENEKVLNLLNQTELKALGYETAVLLEGFDPRGIDTAVLSRYPMWRKPALHRIPMKAKDAKGEYAATKTRGLLEVPLTLPDGTNALVYGLHFPSQANPAYLREQAVAYLNEMEQKAPVGVLVIAGGDFNISSPEEEKLKLYSKELASQWSVTHLEGCSGCFGTIYYFPKKEWSFFDAVLVGKSQRAQHQWQIDPESVEVPTPSKFQVSRFGGPARFDAKSPFGVSDHWPIYVEITKPKPAAALSAGSN